MVSYFPDGSDRLKQEKKHHISRFKMMKLIGFSVFQVFILFYTQYYLFYQSRGEDFANINFKTVMVIYITSAVIKMSFSVRIFILNNTIKSDLITMLVASVIVITTDRYFSVFSSKSNDSSVQNVIYSCITPGFIFLQVASFFCYVLLVKFAVQYQRAKTEDEQQVFYNKVVRAETNAGLVSVLDCYLRAAPQLILQFAIFLRDHGQVDNIAGVVFKGIEGPSTSLDNLKNYLQVVTIVLAFVMMPWSLTSFQGSLRMQEEIKVPLKSRIPYFLWHFFIMVSRIISISGIFAFYPISASVATVIHCLVAAGWLWWSTEPMKFTGHNRFWHLLFCCVFGGVYLFYPINLTDKPTRWKYIVFYVVIFAENLVSNLLWVFGEKELSVEWKCCFVILSQFMFVIAIGFMALYYKMCHPKRTIAQNNFIMHDIIDQIYGTDDEISFD